MRWGMFGAAGVVFVTQEPEGIRVMVQRRSAFAHEGGTWSCAGGALDSGESALVGALREASEEIGAIPDGWRECGHVVFAPASNWSYTTFVVEVPERFGASMNFETDDVAWVTPAAIEGLELHAGFAAAWPDLRSIIHAEFPAMN
jgi:8-oxo-dGTP pyrophosphatase MutT (NUDIX family)